MVEFKSVEELNELRDIPEYKHLYFFEVQHRDKKGKFTHIGYMNRLFATEHDAALFYSKYNPTLRYLNSNGNNTSGCNTKTYLRYKLHIYGQEDMSIPSWDGTLSDNVWSSGLLSNIGEKVELGKVMTKGINKPVAQFPLCPSRDCWCYNCSLSTSKCNGIDFEYTEEQYRLCALRIAKEVRQKYLDSCIREVSSSSLSNSIVSSSSLSPEVSSSSLSNSIVSPEVSSSSLSNSIVSPEVSSSSLSNSIVSPEVSSSSLSNSIVSPVVSSYPFSLPDLPPHGYHLDEKEAALPNKVDLNSITNPVYFSMTGIGFSENDVSIIVDIKSSSGNFLCKIPLTECKRYES